MQDSASSASSFVWFLLLDSATGLPYKGTTSDKVAVSCSADVADFRTAVHLKYDKPNYLRDIPSGALLVYKNKAALDEEKEEPLKSSSHLSGLGATEEDALVVVVPSQSALIQYSFSKICSEPFYSNICKATENNGWIIFEDDVPSTTLKKLYVRDCYPVIAASITPGISKTIITGTPGIGKSLFLIYILWKLVKEGKRVLCIYHPFNIYYDGKGGVFILDTIPPASDFSFWNDALWCLFDAKFKNEAHLGDLPVGRCTFVVSTSPRREMVNDFKKPPVPRIFYMPLWTEAEMTFIAPLFPGVNEWRDRFEILGGIPRHVLEVTEQHPTQILEAACTDCSLDDCIKKVGVNSTITDKSKVIHSLVHITSDPPYTNSSVCYASPTALDIIVKFKGDEARRRMKELLAACEGNPLAASLCGYIFEPYAIELLEKP